MRASANALWQVMQPQKGNAAGDLDVNVVAVQREVSTAHAPCAADLRGRHAGGTPFPIYASNSCQVSVCAGPVCQRGAAPKHRAAPGRFRRVQAHHHRGVDLTPASDGA